MKENTKKKILMGITGLTAAGVAAAPAATALASSPQALSGLSVTYAEGESGPGQSPGGEQPGGSGADTQTYDYSGEVSGTLTASGEEVTADSETIDSSTADVNTALVSNAGTLKITGSTLTKSGDDTNGDNCNFYGINSILLAVNSGSTAYISDSSLSSTSEGSNGIFATDSGVVYANNDTITTTAGNSRGLDATYDGTIVANQMDISTQGDHCAALATDRGGGNISVTNSTLSTAGSGSPLLYSTGDIEVSNVTGTATGSQIAGMEGLNTILIYNSTLSSTITSATASDPIADGVIIYQSTSGDAESTTGDTALFQAVNSTLSSKIASGSMFYVTNTTAKIILKDTTLDFDTDAANLLQIEGNDSNNWGTAGSNGGTVTLSAISQELTGNISVDSISSLDMYLYEGSTWTGAASLTENANGSSDSSGITLSVDGTSTWVVTADTTLTNLNVASGASIVDSDGNSVTIIADGSTVQQGDSSITVTVSGTYSETVDTSMDALSSPAIDRSAFDAYYGTSTTIAEGTTSSDTEDTEEDTGTDSEETTEETNENNLNWWWLLGGAAVVGGFVYVATRKDKKKEEQ